ncbi:MAG: hypothetical protein K8R59_06250 [Thermoanaerobaculales bacterium]|nr:hypothetical protein [Thermoanaerobaculales bacterium]
MAYGSSSGDPFWAAGPRVGVVSFANCSRDGVIGRALRRQRAVFIAVCFLFGAILPASDQVIDEVLATVDSTPILRSDLVLADLVGLADEPTNSLLDARIRLELQYRDLADSGALRRLEIDVPARVETLIDRGGDRSTVLEALTVAGLDWNDLEALAMRMEVARAWTDQHLLPRIVVTLDEVEDAYRRLVVKPAFEQGHDPPPLARVHDRVRQVVEQEKLNQEIERWVEHSRERHEVVRYVP